MKLFCAEKSENKKMIKLIFTDKEVENERTPIETKMTIESENKIFFNFFEPGLKYNFNDIKEITTDE